MKQSLGLLLIALFVTAPVGATEYDGILGQWTTAEGKSRIVLSKCDAGLCGEIVWLKVPVYPADDEKGMAGKPKVDRENPDPALRNNPTVGLQVLRGFTTRRDNVWEDGTVYDPDNGKTYKAKLALENEKTLKVRGFIGFSWIGRTSVWTR
ncbi:MAG: DUF2147 domain-containing protein [Acidiferrobacterales bacterium]